MIHTYSGADNYLSSQVMVVVKNPPASAGDIRDMGSVPGSGRTPGGGNGNPLQYSSPENPMDRELQSMGSQRVGHIHTHIYLSVCLSVDLYM